MDFSDMILMQLIATCFTLIATIPKASGTCSNDCWLKYSFRYDDNWNGCYGDQYVTTYNQYYVGVILCFSTRYKIFLSESLTDKFVNVADGSGEGKDHCELVGARSEEHAEVQLRILTSNSSKIGFFRSFWGEEIKKGEIGRQATTQNGTQNYYIKWYQCGVMIPGSRQVITSPDLLTTNISTVNPTYPKYIAPSPCYRDHINSNSAATTHTSNVPKYPTYSCTPCTPGPYEVHVIKMHQPYGVDSVTKQTPGIAVPVKILSYRQGVNISLLLMTYEATNWEVMKPTNVNLVKIVLASNNIYDSDVKIIAQEPQQVLITRKKMYISGITSVRHYVKHEFGHMSSYTYVYVTSKWTLNVGSCQQEQGLRTTTTDTVAAKSFNRLIVPHIGPILGVTIPVVLIAAVIVVILKSRSLPGKVGSNLTTYNNHIYSPKYSQTQPGQLSWHQVETFTSSPQHINQSCTRTIPTVQFYASPVPTILDPPPAYDQVV